MYKPVKFITEIPYNDFSTFYLFCKPLKILLPVEIEKKTNPMAPTIYNSLKRILQGLKVNISYIRIYHQVGDTFYTYLAIKRNSETFEINISFKDALEISKEMAVPIFVKDKILKDSGIEITKDIIIKSLKE